MKFSILTSSDISSNVKECKGRFKNTSNTGVFRNENGTHSYEGNPFQVPETQFFRGRKGGNFNGLFLAKDCLQL